MVRVSGTHQDEEMPIGLQKHGGVYRLRRRIPQDLVDAYGKREVVRSLGTRDLAEAKRKLAIETVKLDAEWDERRKLAKGRIAVETAPHSKSRLTALRAGRAPTPNILTLMTEAALTARAKRSVEEGGTANQAERSAMVSISDKAGGTLSWSSLVERWAKERKPTPKTKAAHLAVAREFAELAGVDQVSKSSKSDVLNFKVALLDRSITPSNLRTKLSRLRTLANYAFENDLIGAKITEGVRAPKPKEKTRVSFDDDALGKLFGGPVHKDGHRPVQGRGEAAYWVPLIALYTGARLEEIAGLLVTDLTQLGYSDGEADAKAWFFRFASDPDRNRSLKNEESERLVPVHPELIRLGLIEYRRAVEDTKEAQLFPLLHAHASGRRAHKWGQWFGTYLRDTCGVSNKKIVFHSFRHTLKDAARESSVPEELQRAIMGHSASGVAGNYGMGFSRKRIVEGMNSIRITGLPPLRQQG